MFGLLRYKYIGKEIMNTLMRTVFLACAVSSFFVHSVRADVTDIIEKSFDVDESSLFSLNNINGEVDIISWSTPVIKVKAIITADEQEEINLVHIKMKQDNGEISINTKYDDNDSWNNRQTAKVTYKVWLPAETDLSEIEVINGDLKIEGVSGKVKAQVVNGSIKATGLTKDSDISSVNGNIKVRYKSISKALNDINIETVNGSMKLYLPGEVNASLDLEALHGSIKTEFGIRSKDNFLSGHNLQGKIGSGDINVKMESVNGSIKVMKR